MMRYEPSRLIVQSDLNEMEVWLDCGPTSPSPPLKLASSWQDLEPQI